VANGGTGILATEPNPEVARRSWPRWLALGVGMIAVAAAAVVWDAAGARLLLGAIGLFLAGRGAVLLRDPGEVDDRLAGRARALGTGAVVAGAAALAVAVLSADLAARVLLVAVPLLLFAGAAALFGRGGLARRGGKALLVWSALVTGLLVITGVGHSWARATDVATVVAALAVAVLGVPMLIGAANLRAVAARPVPAPRPAACAGCACGAGGCGA
jgi:hypothetical protein